jgi:Lon protease-like protein
LFPLGIVLFPDGPLPLRIFETRYYDMVRRCMREGREFGVVAIREGQEVGPADFYDVGTMAEITDFHQLADGLLGLSCVGRRRFKITARSRQADGLHLGELEWLNPEPLLPVPARHERLSRLLGAVLPQLGEVYVNFAMRLDDAAWVGHRLAEILPIPVADKQHYLEMDDPIERLDGLLAIAPLAPLAPSSGTPGTSGTPGSSGTPGEPGVPPSEPDA